nr:hypothetical protein [Tanacetum cinerariifolium]
MPPTRAQLRNKMVTYLKHMGKYTHNQLKSQSFKEIQMLYERGKKWINDFVPMDYKVVNDTEQQVESSKKRSRADHDKDSVKKQKLKEDDVEKEELRACLDVVPVDDITVNVESLATKYLIVGWKIHTLTKNMMYYPIIRANGSSKNYKILIEMCDDFDRKDIIDLYILDYNLISWRLFDSCEVHVLLMDTRIAIHMLVKRKYPLIREMLSRMLNRRLEIDHESEMAFELIRFIKT